MIPQYSDMIAAERLARESDRLARFTGAVRAYREGAALPRPWHFYEGVRSCPKPPLPSHVAAGRFNTTDDRARRRARLIDYLARQCGRMVPDLTVEPRYADAMHGAIQADIDRILTSDEYADTIQPLDDDSDYEYLRLVPVWYVTWLMSDRDLPMPSVALKTKAQPVPYLRRTYVHSVSAFKTRDGDGFSDIEVTSASLAAMRKQQAQIDQLSAQIDDLFN